MTVRRMKHGKKIKELCGKYECIKGINFSKNFGQHAALMAGYSHAEGDIIVSLDDDGQTPISDVERMIAKLSEGYDVVFAKYDSIKQSKFRIWGSKVNEWMTEVLLGKPKEIEPTSYFVVRRYIVDEMLKYSNPYPYIGGLIYRITKNIANVEVVHRERMQGKSNYTLKKLLAMWINGFTAFSVVPLRISTVLGVSCAAMGFLYAVYTVIKKLLIPSIAVGYSSIMVAILIIGGLILMVLGMIGEYLGRIYICINNSPQYVVKEVYSKHKI